MTGLRADLDSQGTPVSVSSGSYPLTSTLFWMNGGTASALGLTGYNQDFGASPVSGLLSGNGSIAVSTGSISGNLATFTATAVLPANYTESLSGLSATISGSIRAGHLPEPGGGHLHLDRRQ